MASREGDIALWLHNKLGSTDDLWSGSSICSQLSRDKLINIQDCFHNLQSYVKVKLLLSFLHVPKRNIEEWKHELEEIINMAQDDTDQWVAVIGNFLKNFPGTGSLNTEVEDHHIFFHEVLGDLRKLVRKSHDIGMTPLECLYLGRTALTSVAGQTHQPNKHFTVKRKPKSAALRAELLQKSSEAASKLKKSGSVPVKSRSFAKKMDDKTPMRGIPNSLGSGAGFLKASPLARSFGGNASQRSLASRREGGIKLLDISEQPVGSREAKRRRKIAEQEAIEQHKKEKESQSVTPDYAANLITATNLSSPAVGASGPSYLPTTRVVTTTAVTLTLQGGGTSTQQARENLQQQLQQQLGQPRPVTTVLPLQSQSQNQAAPTSLTVTTNIAPAPTLPIVTPQQPQATQQKKGLSLTREQMMEAQEMFRTSNKVTRPEKALILGFMAGSRENPCPSQGDIVNIRLSENVDSVEQPDGMFKPMVVDTYFQMNYSTGEWKRIRKFREVDVE